LEGRKGVVVQIIAASLEIGANKIISIVFALKAGSRRLATSE
jgi:hypothetical protein